MRWVLPIALILCAVGSYQAGSRHAVADVPIPPIPVCFGQDGLDGPLCPGYGDVGCPNCVNQACAGDAFEATYKLKYKFAPIESGFTLEETTEACGYYYYCVVPVPCQGPCVKTDITVGQSTGTQTQRWPGMPCLPI